MKASEFDQAFDEGSNIVQDLDISKARRSGLDPKRINVDIPTWMIADLDREAGRIGVSRQAIIKMWLAERLEARKPELPERTEPATFPTHTQLMLVVLPSLTRHVSMHILDVWKSYKYCFRNRSYDACETWHAARIDR